MLTRRRPRPWSNRSASSAIGRLASKADVSKIADLQMLVDPAVSRFGRVDIMVNNAGVETRTSILDTTEDQYDKVMAINLKSAFFGTQIAAKQMIKQGGGGRIINISSVHEDWPMPGNTPYCVSKGGMRMLTRTAGVELAKHNILVVGVAPGAVATPINIGTMNDSAKLTQLDAAIPLRRMARPEEIANVSSASSPARVPAISPRPQSLPMAASCITASVCSGRQHLAKASKPIQYASLQMTRGYPLDRMSKRIAPVLAMATLASGHSLAQSVVPQSDTEVSKEIENPVTRRITVPLRYEADFLDGPYKATKDTFSIDQAVVPFWLNEDWALITRTKLPGEAQPPKKLGDHWAGGLSNGYTTFFLSPEHGEGFYWGAGPALLSLGDQVRDRRQQMELRSVGGLHKGGRKPVGVRRGRQQYLVVRRPAGQLRPDQPTAAQPDRQLSFRRGMVRRLVAEHHDELDRERRQMDGAGRRRFG